MDIENGLKTTITASELMTIMVTSAIENRGCYERGVSSAARLKLITRRPEGAPSNWPFDSDDNARLYAANWLMEMAGGLGRAYGSEAVYGRHERAGLVLRVMSIARALKFDVDSEDGIKRLAATYVSSALEQADFAGRDAV